MKTIDGSKRPASPSTPVDGEAAIRQYSWGITAVFALATACWGLLPTTGYLFSALVFLLAIVVAGTQWARGPVLLMGVMSALIWNFLFIPPQFTLHIDKAQDAVMFSLFFVVALSMGQLITRVRAREEALERHHREREELLAEKHRVEIRAEAERLHRTLLDSASHELKTPIAIIRTALDGLDASDPLVAEIDTAARRLQRIVENFLEMTRVESDAVKPQADWCEVGDIVHAACAPLVRELAQYSLRITGTADLPLVMVDSRLLAQALGNVLHNATAYATEGTEIDIHARLKDDELKIGVRDHGPGISPGEAERVFDKFYRLPGSPPGGTGLGLAITRGLLKAMEGDIEVCHASGGGAEFILHVPVEVRDMSQQQPP